MMTSNSNTSQLVKVAVNTTNKEGLLKEIDQSNSLKSIIQDFLNSWNINEPVENYILQLDCLNGCYFTETNKSEIKDGTMLKLTYSPSKQIDITLDKLKNGKLDQNELKLVYLRLVNNCKDRFFAKEFINKNGIPFLANTIVHSFIENSELEIRSCLDAFIELLEHGLIDWNFIEKTFIEKIVNFINNCHSQLNKRILLSSLIILENIVSICPYHYKLIESLITLPNLINHVNSSENDLDARIHQNCIALINSLFLKSELLNKKSIAKTICSKQYRNIILNNIIKTKNQEIGSEMLHQLYLLQKNILSLYEEKLKYTNDQDTNDKIEKICRIAFENDLNYLKESNSKFRKINENHKDFDSEDYAKIGFINFKEPCKDFIDNPGILTLDLIIHFARNYTDSFIKIILENCSRSDKEHECPFIRSTIEITKFLVYLLKIEEPANDEGKEFFTFFFTSDYPLEELFCICVPLLNKTWKEMRATLLDFDKVISVFKQQLVESLKNIEDLTSFESLKKRLSSLNYNEIINIWQREKISKKEWENNTQSISELKQNLKPELMNLIKQQRIQFLTEGTKFVKYTNKGQRLKNKFWFCRLSNKSKIFFYGDCDEEKIPSIEHLPKKLPILDIKYILTGKDCPHMKDNKSKKSTYQLAFSLMTENDINDALNFVAPDEKTFNYWIDGLNTLLGLEMNSKEIEKDLDLLLSLEMKLKLIETEGFNIPDVPPAIPPPPPNYDFFCESS